MSFSSFLFATVYNTRSLGWGNNRVVNPRLRRNVVPVVQAIHSSLSSSSSLLLSLQSQAAECLAFPPRRSTLSLSVPRHREKRYTIAIETEERMSQRVFERVSSGLFETKSGRGEDRRLLWKEDRLGITGLHPRHDASSHELLHPTLQPSAKAIDSLIYAYLNN